MYCDISLEISFFNFHFLTYFFKKIRALQNMRYILISVLSLVYNSNVYLVLKQQINQKVIAALSLPTIFHPHNIMAFTSV
jgi:hypothetical protein